MLNLNSHSQWKRQKRTSGTVKKIWDDLGRKVLLCQMNFCCGKVLHRQQLQLNQSRIHVHSKVRIAPDLSHSRFPALRILPLSSFSVQVEKYSWARAFLLILDLEPSKVELSQDSLTDSIFSIQSELISSLRDLVYSDSNFIETLVCQPPAQYATLSLLLNSPCIFIWL